MQIAALAKVTAADAQEICARASAGGFALEAAPGMATVQFLNQLVSEKKLDEAVQFLAFALPPREATWWACMCARAQLHDPIAPALLAALEASEAWVRRPTEENRRAAMASAQATQFDSPAVWAAVAAFWSGGSLAPPELPVVPPAPHLNGVAVAGAVRLAAVQTEPQKADEKRARYIAAAVDIANGGAGRALLGE